MLRMMRAKFTTVKGKLRHGSVNCWYWLKLIKGVISIHCLLVNTKHSHTKLYIAKCFSSMLEMHGLMESESFGKQYSSGFDY